MKEFDYIGGKRIENLSIEKLEKLLGVNFPESYKKIVLEHNGACIIPDAFKVSENIESINNFHDVEKDYQFSDERLPSKIVPFARDAGDNQICFDFREEGKVKIVFWNYEIERIDNGALAFIADSFDEFLDMLFEFDE